MSSSNPSVFLVKVTGQIETGEFFAGEELYFNFLYYYGQDWEVIKVSLISPQNVSIFKVNKKNIHLLFFTSKFKYSDLFTDFIPFLSRRFPKIGDVLFSKFKRSGRASGSKSSIQDLYFVYSFRHTSYWFEFFSKNPLYQMKATKL